MDHRTPHYFTSVPSDNPARQPIAPYISKANRPPAGQHQPRMVVPEPPTQWSRAATVSPSAAAIQLSRRRYRTPPAGVVGPAAEDCVAADYGTPSALPAPTDWLNHQSTSPHYPPESRHFASRGGSTASEKLKHRHAHTPPRQAKMRRIHREDLGVTDVLAGQMVTRGCPSDGAPRLPSPTTSYAAITFPRTGTLPVEAQCLATTAHSTIGCPPGGLTYPVVAEGAVRCDGVPLEAGGTQTSTKNAPGRTELCVPSPDVPSAHYYGQYNDPYHAATYSRELFSGSGVKSNPRGHSVEFAEIDQSKTPAHFEEKPIQRYDPLNEEVQIMCQNKLTVDSAHPYHRSVHNSSLDHRQKRFAKGFSMDTAKDTVNFPRNMEPRISHLVGGLRQGIDSSFPAYHKLGHYHHSISCSAPTSTRPLASFQKFPSHLPDSISPNEPHINSFTGSSLRESYEFNRHVVAAFDLTTSRSTHSRDVDCSKVYPAMQTPSDITNNLYAFSHKLLPEPSNAEAFDTAWHSEKINHPPMNIIPAHTSSPYHATTLGTHVPSSSNLFYSGSDEVQSGITNTKVSTAVLGPSCTKFTSMPINQPDNNLVPHNLVQQNFGASCNSLSGNLDKSRNPTMLLSSSTMTSTPNTRTSSMIEINSENEDSIHKKVETHTEQRCSVVVTSCQKKFKGSSHSSQFLSTGPHSETDTHKVASKPQRGHNSKISHGISDKEVTHQSNTRPYQLPHCNSKPKMSTGGTRRRRRHAVGLICGVCGDSARSLHFGGVSCDSCKAFFRRAVIARAYPAFLCVTTGLPPKIKCQKSDKNSIESSKPSDIQEVILDSPVKDSSQADSSPKDPHKKVQSATISGIDQIISSSASKLATEDDRLGYNDNSICSIPKATTSEAVTSSFQDGNSQSSYRVCQNTMPSCHIDTPQLAPVHKITLNEKCNVLNSSGNKQCQPSANAKDAQYRLGSKTFVKCPPITITTRKYCQACRFQRCIDIGMEISWVTLENDAQKNTSNQQTKNDFNRKGTTGNRFASEDSGGSKNEVIGDVDNKGYKMRDKNRNSDLNKYLTRDEQKQIEDLVDIYRSVFWGVPEPSYHRPALIDFPPPFALSELIVNTNESQDEIKQQSSYDSKTATSNLSATHPEAGNSSSNVPTATSADISNSVIQPPTRRVDSYDEVPVCSSDSNFSQEVNDNDGLEGDNGQQYLKIRPEHHYRGSENCMTEPGQPEDLYIGMPFSPDKQEENPVLGMSVEEIISLPIDPLGVNMFRKSLSRRPRPWLIRQLMGYTLRFLNVVVKLLKSVGRSLSETDRTLLLRQGMTGLTFMNSVFTYDTDVEGWPERVFPPLPLVLQDEEAGCASDQPDYLQGIPMHSDEVASVVAAHVLEHQLTFIRGMKALVGCDYTSMFLLMAIMLFDSTQEGLEQPQSVEKIQGNYCHLLKQYVGWKFKNGSPQNPGLGRPFNFTPLSSLPQNISHPESAPTDEYSGNLGAENKNMIAEGTQPLHSKDLSGTSEINENRKCHDGRNIFRFERPEGMYYSPPYPPSPVNPSSIFPFLMTRLADLKQIAHGYSSTPFLLQGSEVDEIANLVARIEVFMSDILATEPERDFDDNGGSGGGVGGSGGIQDTEYNDMEPSASKPGKGNSRREYTESKNSKEIFNSDTLQQDDIADDDPGWDCIPEQDLEWDSYSSGDDSNSISSQSAVSIGSSFDGIAGVLEAGEGEKLGNNMECGPEEVFESLEIWEKDHPISNFHEAEDLVNACRDNTFTDGMGQINALDFNKSMYNTACNPAYDKCEVQAVKFSESGLHLSEPTGNMQYMKSTSQGEDNLVSLSCFMDSQSFKGEIDSWDKAIHSAEVNSEVQDEMNKVMDKDGNLDQFERGFREQSMIISWREKPSGQSDTERVGRKYTFNGHITEKKGFQFPSSSDGLLDSTQNADIRQEAQNCSLWDRIKATGKALLGLDSSGPRFHHGSFWKGGSNMDEHTVLQDGDGDLENWLNVLERPDSNSSGYVSTISSPPPLLNIQREFDAYDSGGDWEDLFQKL